jgi:hypothetical protein
MSERGSPELGAPFRVPSRVEAQAVDPLGDMSFGHVDLQELLNEILQRVLVALGADTAAVLLIDASGRELVARAAIGIEDEVRQGVRVPLGQGFAGRIAASGQPLILDLVDSSTVSNPILWRHGIRCLLGVPLVAGDEVIGVLHVGTLGDRRWQDDDAALLVRIADRVGAAVQVRLLDADRDAAEAIQRGLLPSAPSRIGSFDCSARYVPAERGGIGGDWYDVFELDGDIWLIVGDVVGHGLQSAIVMGRVRSAIRAYALLTREPDQVLALTDRKVGHFEVGSLATAAVAVIRPPATEARIALAGHPPFAVARPGQPTELVDARPGPPLGVGGARPEPASVPLSPGSVLVGYTDGLIERRGESIDVGLERLRSSVVATSPWTVCEDVMAGSLQGHIPEDDVALIALRRHAP